MRSARPIPRGMAKDSVPQFNDLGWDRRVAHAENRGRRRTDNLEPRGIAHAVARLGLAVRIGVTIALAAAVGATLIAWRAHLVTGPVAILLVLAVTVPWVIAHRLASRLSRQSSPFSHVDRKIWLP